MRIKAYNLILEDEAGNEHIIASNDEAPELPVEESEYLEDGFSREVRYGCCYRSKSLDEWLDDLLANGDDYEVAFAMEAPRWFCLRLPSREPYPQDVDARLRMNWLRVQKYGFSNQVVLMGFQEDVDGELIDGIVTPIRYFNPSKVHEYLADGVKYVWRNAIEYSRTGGRAGWGK